MHWGTTNHVGKSLHLTDNAQHTFHSRVVAKQIFSLHSKAKSLLLAQKCWKTDGKDTAERYFFTCVWKLEQPYVETKLHRKTARPFTVLQVHSSVNHIVIKNSGAEQIIKHLLEWTIKAHLISFSMQSLKYIQLYTQHSVLCWQIMVA